MANSEKKTGGGPLTVAAASLEGEIKRFEDLVAELGRLEEAPAPKVSLVPMFGRHFAGAGFVLAF